MSLLLFLFSLVTVCLAETPIDEIIVEAHKDFEVYVAPAKIKNEAEGVEAIIGDYSIFGYASSHSKEAQIMNGCCSYEPLTQNHSAFKVFNEDTIEYVWDNCDYLKNAKACSYKNNHYLLETHITVDKHQIVVEMFLYDTDLQIISRGSYSSNIKINWVKQQAIQSTVTTTNQGLQANQNSRNCSGNTCSSTGAVSGNSAIISTSVNKPKEELPLKWTIPHRLLDKHIHQASLGLWLGVILTNE